MKFGNYKFNARGINNLGDNMQIIAIDGLYESMGIGKEEIVYLDTNELSIYNGEYVILPVTMPLVDFQTGGIASRFSERIIPVFIGFTMVKDTLILQEVEYLKRMSPIGCRDERTLNTIRKYGITAYLHGCITVTLPQRDMSKKYDKVYLVDAPEKIEDLLPNDIKSNLVKKTHMHSDLSDDPKKVMQNYYNEYRANAKLVITSLLHCALPCIAAGIPVILAKSGEGVSYRFSWVEKLTHIYTEPEFEKIEWNPELIIYEEHKKRVEDLTIKRLWAAYDTYSEIMDLSYYYEEREKNKYINDACQSLITYLDTNWTEKNINYKYSIWGLTQIAEYMVSYISRRFPNAQLCHVYDAFREEEFYGILSQHPDSIIKYPEETVFISTNGAMVPAKQMLKKIGVEIYNFAFMEPVK